jgi:hypothetical protein
MKKTIAILLACVGLLHADEYPTITSSSRDAAQAEREKEREQNKLHSWQRGSTSLEDRISDLEAKIDYLESRPTGPSATDRVRSALLIK